MNRTTPRRYAERLPNYGVWRLCFGLLLPLCTLPPHPAKLALTLPADL